MSSSPQYPQFSSSTSSSSSTASSDHSFSSLSLSQEEWTPLFRLGPFELDSKPNKGEIQKLVCTSNDAYGIKGSKVVRYDPIELWFSEYNYTEPTYIQPYIHSSFPSDTTRFPTSSCIVKIHNKNETTTSAREQKNDDDNDQWRLSSHIGPLRSKRKIPVGSTDLWTCQTVDEEESKWVKFDPPKLAFNESNYTSISFVSVYIHTSLYQIDQTINTKCSYNYDDDYDDMISGNGGGNGKSNSTSSSRHMYSSNSQNNNHNTKNYKKKIINDNYDHNNNIINNNNDNWKKAKKNKRTKHGKPNRLSQMAVFFLVLYIAKLFGLPSLTDAILKKKRKKTTKRFKLKRKGGGLGKSKKEKSKMKKISQKTKSKMTVSSSSFATEEKSSFAIAAATTTPLSDVATMGENVPLSDDSKIGLDGNDDDDDNQSHLSLSSSSKDEGEKEEEEITESIEKNETITSLSNNNSPPIDDNDEYRVQESSDNGWEKVENPSSYIKKKIEKKQQTTQKEETPFTKFAFKRNQVQQKYIKEGALNNNNDDDCLQMSFIEEEEGIETKKKIEPQEEPKQNTEPPTCGVSLTKPGNLISSSKPLLVQQQKQNKNANGDDDTIFDKENGENDCLEMESLEDEKVTNQDSSPTLCVPSSKPGNSTASELLVQPKKQNNDDNNDDDEDDNDTECDDGESNEKEGNIDKDTRNNDDKSCDVEMLLAECTVTHSTEDAYEIEKEPFYEFVLYIDGMTCRGCEKVVQTALTNVFCHSEKDKNEDVASVVVDWKSASATFTSLSPRLNLHKITEAVDAVGFEIYFMAQQKQRKKKTTTASGAHNNNTAKYDEYATKTTSNSGVGGCKNNRKFLSSLKPETPASPSSPVKDIGPPPGFEFATNRESSLSLLDDILKGGTSTTPLRRYRCHCGGEECICRSQPLSTDDPGREFSLSDLCVRLEANLTPGWWSSIFDETPSPNNNNNSNSTSNSANTNANEQDRIKNNDDDAVNNSINLDKKNVRTLSAPFSLEDLLRSERPEIRDRLASIPIPCGCGTDDHDEEKDEKKTNN